MTGGRREEKGRHGHRYRGTQTRHMHCHLRLCNALFHCFWCYQPHGPTVMTSTADQDALWVYFAPTYNTLHVPPKLVTLQFCFSTEIVLPCNRTTKCYFRLKPNTALPQFKAARDIASVSVSNFVGQQRTVSQFCLYVCGSKTKPLTDSQPQHNVCYQHT